jgi:hypothetical protein
MNTATNHAKCPIPGCNMPFSSGILGWHTHVMKFDAHPHWHPETHGEARKSLFVQEFPQFFEQSVASKHSSHPPEYKKEETDPGTPKAKKASTPPPALPSLSLSIRALTGDVLDLLLLLQGSEAPPAVREKAIHLLDALVVIETGLAAA